MTENAPDIEESLTHKVVKDNQLIQNAKTDLTKNEQKLVNYLVSMIKPTDEDLKSYRVSISDFARLTGIDKTHISRDFKKIINGIDEKAFWFENDERLSKISWVLTPDYFKKEGFVELRLDPRMKKYLIGLKKNFTEYELYNVLALKTKYAITIFEFLKSYQYKASIDIGLDKFKELISANTASYKSFGIFRQRVLDPALDDINDNTELDVTYKCLDSHKKEMKSLQGKKVYYLHFIVKAKETMETFEVYTRTKDRVKNMDISDQVPHQLSFDTDNETTDIYDDTTNQKVN